MKRFIMIIDVIGFISILTMLTEPFIERFAGHGNINLDAHTINRIAAINSIFFLIFGIWSFFRLFFIHRKKLEYLHSKYSFTDHRVVIFIAIAAMITTLIFLYKFLLSLI